MFLKSSEPGWTLKYSPENSGNYLHTSRFTELLNAHLILIISEMLVTYLVAGKFYFG